MRTVVQMNRENAMSVAAAALVTAAAALNRYRLRRWMRREGARATRKVRYGRGKLRGVWYRATGGAPTAVVNDETLAERVRAALGPLSKQLDVPRVHVAVQGGVSTLTGRVGSPHDVDVIRDAVASIPGVRDVECLLTPELLPGDTRPSEGGGAATPSKALKRLTGSVLAAGVPEPAATSALRAVLSVFVGRLPDGERAHLFAHLPEDVRALVQAAPPEVEPRLRSVAAFAAAVEATADLHGGDTVQVTQAVLSCLRELVPEEADDIATTVPAELRALWTGA
jgi:uncharacterized protein (DUF2267 family)